MQEKQKKKVFYPRTILPILLKALKPINIQHSNLHFGIRILSQRLNNLLNEPENAKFWLITQ